MKVLITGIAGFIGSHTADKFIEEGHEVVGIDDYSTGNHLNVPKGVEFYCEDVTEADRIEKLVAEVRPEIVIHLAAQPSLLESVAYPEFDALVNIVGTLNMIVASRKVDVKRFVFSSTSAVYSSYDTREDTVELFPISPYGISKLTAERYIQSLITDVGVILRYANVYGPRQVALGENQLVPRVLDHIYRQKDFKINGKGTQTRDFIFVKDVANANYAAATGPLPEDFCLNVSTGLSYSVLDVVKEIASLTAFTGSFDKGPAVKDDREKVEMPNDLFSASFDWEPLYSLHEGLKETVNAYVG